MEFCRKTLTATVFSLLALPSFANYLPNTFELMLGYNHSFHNTNKLHIGDNNTEIDSLDETDSGNDFIGGIGYAYNILPWFVAYHNKDLTHSALQRVWVGLDLIFMNTTQTGDEVTGDDLSFFTYEFTEDTTRLMFNSEVDFNSPWKNVFPFVQASVGVARIVASFSDEPNPAPGLSGGGISLPDEVNYNLAYSLGAGIKFLVMHNFQFGVSYLFTDFGIVETEMDSSSVTLSEPLRDHLYTSSALFNLNYLF